MNNFDSNRLRENFVAAVKESGNKIVSIEVLQTKCFLTSTEFRLSIPNKLIDCHAKRTWRRFAEEYKDFFYLSYMDEYGDKEMVQNLSDFKLKPYKDANFSIHLDYLYGRTKEAMRQAIIIFRKDNILAFGVIDKSDDRKLYGWGSWDGTPELTVLVEEYIKWKKKRNKGR